MTYAVLVRRPGAAVIHPDHLAITGPYETLELAELMAARFNTDTDYEASVFGLCSLAGAMTWWDWTRTVHPLEQAA
jgi:hypothetical protein